MYTNFRVKNFRGFEDLEMTDLKRVNLIAGKNNTGKTALLEAILIHLGRYDPNLLLRTALSSDTRIRFISGEFIARATNLPKWDILFYDFDHSRKIVLSGDLSIGQLLLPGFTDESNPESLEISIVDINRIPDNSTILQRITRERDIDLPFQDISILEYKHGYGKSQYLAQYEGRVISERRTRERLPAILLSARERVMLEDDASRFSELRRMKQDDRLLSTLQCIEPRLQSLELLYDGEPPKIHGYLKNLKQPIPLSSMGDGIQRIASLILAIGTARNGIVFIDEIENGLHYSVQGEIWNAIGYAARSFDVQIFATTHSREMIAAAQEAFKDTPDEFRYYRLDRNVLTGQIEAIKYNPETFAAAIEHEYEVRG